LPPSAARLPASVSTRAADESLPLPGYSHLQRAVVSSTAMWFAGFAEGFIDNAQRARDTLAWIDANPLGTAAGYGVNLKLDRDHTTQTLGFARLQVSPVMRSCRAASSRSPRSMRSAAPCSTCAGSPGT
jgi:argininosuccinate lyase